MRKGLWGAQVGGKQENRTRGKKCSVCVCANEPRGRLKQHWYEKRKKNSASCVCACCWGRFACFSFALAFLWRALALFPPVFLRSGYAHLLFLSFHTPSPSPSTNSLCLFGAAGETHHRPPAFPSLFFILLQHAHARPPLHTNTHIDTRPFPCLLVSCSSPFGCYWSIIARRRLQPKPFWSVPPPHLSVHPPTAHPSDLFSPLHTNVPHTHPHPSILLPRAEEGPQRGQQVAEQPQDGGAAVPPVGGRGLGLLLRRGLLALGRRRLLLFWFVLGSRVD